MNRRLAVTVLGATVLVVLGTPQVEAQAARVSIRISDSGGVPIAGATLNITCEARTDLAEIKTSNAKGRISVIHIDSHQTYRYEVSKIGYQTQVREVRPDSAATTKLEVVLPSTQPEGEPQSVMPGRGGRAVELFAEGIEAQRRGDLDLAEERFQQAAKLDPNAAEPHVALAVVAHQRERFVDAAAAAERALAISPNNQQALLLRHDAYRQLGDEESAAAAAADLREHGVISAAAGTVYAEGMAEYRAGNLGLARAKFEHAVELDPGLVNAHLMLGSMALEEGDPEGADARAESVLELDPGNANALRVRYDAQRALGNTEVAERALAALIAADPKWAADELFNHAVELYNGGDMDGAATALAQVVAADPADAKARFLLGMASYGQGRQDVAKEHLEAFLELAPEDPDASVVREILEYVRQIGGE